MKNTMTEPVAAGVPLQREIGWHRFRSMNTDIHLALAAPDLAVQRQFVEESFRYFEQLLSRFLPTSELSRLNDCRQPQFLASPDLFAAVQAALWAAQQTGGIFDPAVAVYLEAAGYDSTFETLPDRRPLTAVDHAAGRPAACALSFEPIQSGFDYRHFVLDPFTRLIGRPAGLRLDLGGMGKGWTADRVADTLCATGCFLLNAGGDLYAYGSPGGRGWEVQLSHPLHPRLNFATLRVDYHAVATSTIAKRRWVNNGAVQHHLIDPRHGRPANSDVISVSVVGGRVFTAEVYAKAALILGLENGLALLEGTPDMEGVLFSTSGTVYQTSGMQRYIERLVPGGY